VKTGHPKSNLQREFDFSAPRPRPFLAGLPAAIDTYEDGVAQFFHWRTGLNYYATVDQIVDFVITTGRIKVFDFLADTATFALKLAGRKAFAGRIYSFESNITLLERAKQRARHLNLQQVAEFCAFDGTSWPVPDSHADIAVSIFDFHRHSARRFLAEAVRILGPDGHLLVAEMIEPKTDRNLWAWKWKKLYLNYMRKNRAEAQGIYYNREEMIALMFEAGFRQIVIQELKQPTSPHEGVFSLVAATK